MARDEVNVAVDPVFEDVSILDSAWAEKSLLAAVLLSAVNDLNKAGDVNRKATEFFLSRDEEYLFSFRSICQFLNIDPQQVLRIAGLR